MMLEGNTRRPCRLRTKDFMSFLSERPTPRQT
jgi:hypothetical protein